MLMAFDPNDSLAPGATPLDANEIAGLKLKHISLISELDEFENLNITNAMLWLRKQKRMNPLTDTFLRKLHKKMFGEVWEWASQYRTSDKNIGVPWFEVTAKVKALLEDTQYWIDNQTYNWDELGARLHHRLVSIHPFPNGNGRHARLFCDAVLATHGRPLFTRRGVGTNPSEVRSSYIAALQAADAKDISPLLLFLQTPKA
jgi:Fic-DOC domain mobile mystery protein B